jgi:hypothetical protein
MEDSHDSSARVEAPVGSADAERSSTPSSPDGPPEMQDKESTHSNCVGSTRFVSPKWRKPAPLGYASAMDSLGSVAAPLLAGFSLASLVAISDDAPNFRWPGAAILSLVIAAIALIGAVQCSFNARQYIWSAAEVVEWWPDMEEGSPREVRLRNEQDLAFRRWKAWVKWARTTYDVGILSLLTALALTIPPPHSAGIQSSLRWGASGVAFAACACDAAWIVLAIARRSREGRHHGNLPEERRE